MKKIERKSVKEGVGGDAVGDCFRRALTGAVTHPVSGMHTLQLERRRQNVTAKWQGIRVEQSPSVERTKTSIILRWARDFFHCSTDMIRDASWNRLLKHYYVLLSQEKCLEKEPGYLHRIAKAQKLNRSSVLLWKVAGHQLVKGIICMLDST